MQKRRRLIERNNGWHRPSMVVIVSSLSVSMAQSSWPHGSRSSDSNIQQHRTERNLRSSGGHFSNGIDEGTLDLPPTVGIQEHHRDNRRTLYSKHLVPFQHDKPSQYAIGTSEIQERRKYTLQAESVSRPRNHSSKSSKKSSRSRPRSDSSQDPPDYPSQDDPDNSSQDPPDNASQDPPDNSSHGSSDSSRPTSDRSACTIELRLVFLQLSAIPPALFVDPNVPDDQVLGTRYIYNDGLRNRKTLDELTGSRASGICTRIQAREGNADIGIQPGRGRCDFTYVLRDLKNRELMFTASGDVVDSKGGVLAITGGSQSTLGAFGEIELLPVNLSGNDSFEIETGDFFLNPLFYSADARMYVPCDL